MKIILFALAIASMHNANSQTLASTGSLSTARWQHESQLLSTGKVLTFGGDDCSSSNIVYSSSELYNPTTGTWSATGSMIEHRTHLASIVLQNGKVLAIGGSDENQDVLSTCEIYDVALGTWSATGSMINTRYGHRAVLLPNGKVFVSGGRSDVSAEIYDPALSTWTAAANSNYTHGKDGAMILLNNGKVLFTGGESSSPGSRAEIYDPATDSWTWTGSMQLNRNNHSMTKLSDGRILIFGGNFTPIQSEIFDPAGNTFTLTGAPSQNRSNCIGILLTDGRVLVYGIGNFFSASDTKIIEIYNPATGTWTAPVTNLIGANLYTMVSLQNSSILIIGGSFTTGNGASPVCRIIQGVSALGIEEEKADLGLFNLYPNPAKNEIQINFSDNQLEIEKVEISSVNGQIVKTISSPKSNVFYINELTSGIYYMKVYSGSLQQTVKFIVE